VSKSSNSKFVISWIFRHNHYCIDFWNSLFYFQKGNFASWIVIWTRSSF